MIFVLFEVTIKENCMEHYLAMAGNLKDYLSEAKGFIRSERFSSLISERKLLSLSVWEDEESVSNWRNQTEHRLSKRQGRDALFESYHITVASQPRSYSNTQRSEAPEDSNVLSFPTD